MGLYSLYADTENYRSLGFDRHQCREVFGEDIQNQFDVNFEAKPYTSVWQPLNVSFADDGSGLSGDLIPDISERDGRLFLSPKAYDILKDLIYNDGEFLRVTYEDGEAYMFNPLSLAESVDGLDQKLSIKSEWGDIENTAFHEDRVKGFNVFRSKFDNYRSIYCQESVKSIIEEHKLNGLIFTRDLGNPYTAKYTDNIQNS